MLDKKAFNKISKADQTIVREVMNDAMNKLGKINRDNDKQARLAMQKQGIQFVSISKQEWQRSENIARQSIEALGKKGIYTADMYQLLKTHLNDFRSQTSSAADAKP